MLSTLGDLLGELENAWKPCIREFKTSGLDDRSTRDIATARDNPSFDDETTALEPVGGTVVTWNYAGCLVWLKEIADLPALLFYKPQLFANHDRPHQLGVR